MGETCSPSFASIRGLGLCSETLKIRNETHLSSLRLPGAYGASTDGVRRRFFEICPSCGFQFGVSDDDRGITYEQWREQWRARGMPWSSSNPPPKGWDPARQLAELGKVSGTPDRAPSAASASEGKCALQS